MPPIGYPATARSGSTRSHAVIPPATEGWESVALTEWELVGEVWEGQHPHDGFTYVLVGTPHVTRESETVEIPAGGIVQVPPDRTGIYRVAGRARMLASYGPNPEGRPIRVGGPRAR